VAGACGGSWTQVPHRGQLHNHFCCCSACRCSPGPLFAASPIEQAAAGGDQHPQPHGGAPGLQGGAWCCNKNVCCITPARKAHPCAVCWPQVKTTTPKKYVVRPSSVSGAGSSCVVTALPAVADQARCADPGPRQCHVVPVLLLLLPLSAGNRGCQVHLQRAGHHAGACRARSNRHTPGAASRQPPRCQSSACR
jgi:hypothetical protein